MGGEFDDDMDAPDALVAASYVSHTEKKKGETESGLVKMYRDLKTKNPKQYLAELRMLVKAHQEFKAKKLESQKETAAVGPGVDVGTDRCVLTCEEWLKENGAKEPKKFW